MPTLPAPRRGAARPQAMARKPNDGRRAHSNFAACWRAERTHLLAAIDGDLAADERERVGALVLLRVMVGYFLQRAGLLAGDTNYLRHQLDRMRAESGLHASGGFYRRVLLPLFRTGDPVRRGLDAGAADAPVRLPPSLAEPLAACQVERDRADLRIADAAFARLFAFCDTYRWQLDETRPTDAGAITPAALSQLLAPNGARGHLGAHYTADDITGYIAANTIVPTLLDGARDACPTPFARDGLVWRLLGAAPDHSIHAALRRGVDQPVPPEVAVGMQDAGRRSEWNRPAGPGFALAGETWRAHIERRGRYAELRARLANGELADANDLVTANLDLVSFTRELLARCDDPALALAFWRSLTGLTILDPTCGTGAFLVGALRVLTPLYAACLQSIREMAERDAVEESAGPGDALWAILAESERTGGAAVFAARTIVTRNLHGVDLDGEAAAIAHLRLLLSICAQVAHVTQMAQTGRAADALSSIADIRPSIHTGDALTGRMRLDDAPPMETAPPGGAQRPWAHPPLDWPAVFPRVMRERGGFDVAIGNPPYVRYHAPPDADPLLGYQTRPAGNLYAMVVERALGLLRPGGRLGMIVPIASVSTAGMAPLQRLYAGHQQWHSHFATRPAKLFPDVDMNLTITLLRKRPGAASVPAPIFSTTYHRWRSADPAERATLFQRLAYAPVPRDPRLPNLYPKIGSAAEVALLRRMLAHGHRLGDYVTRDGTAIYYHSGGRYWRKALPVRLSSHYKELRVPARLAPVVGCLLSSQLFYWWWIVNSNCMDVVAREVVGLPVFDLDRADSGAFAALWPALQAALGAGAAARRRRGARIATDEVNFDVARCKPIIDAIDRALAAGYGFSAEQLDFTVSYDLRFRLGGAG